MKTLRVTETDMRANAIDPVKLDKFARKAAQAFKENNWTWVGKQVPTELEIKFKVYEYAISLLSIVVEGECPEDGITTVSSGRILLQLNVKTGAWGAVFGETALDDIYVLEDLTEYWDDIVKG